MKHLTSTLMLLALVAAAYPQTEDLGMSAFANEKGAIKVAVDASLVNLAPDNPYLMFVVYMAPKAGNRNIVVSRDGVVMVYKGQEYKMPSLQEFRKGYGGGIRDITFYRHLGKEGIISSWTRLYDFPLQGEFFPPLTLNSQLPRDEGSMYNFAGFVTKCYFKNPGLQKGDSLVLKVTAKNDPALTGEVAMTLK